MTSQVAKTLNEPLLEKGGQGRRGKKKGKGTPAQEIAATPSTLVSPDIDLVQEVKYVPFTSIGCPAESYPREKRVAMSPETVTTYVQMGYTVNVEAGAGKEASMTDDMYRSAGAQIVDAKTAFGSDVVLKVRAPVVDEIGMLNDNGTLLSFVYPAQNKEIVNTLREKRMNLFAMDCVPRISRAQTFDALSSMANIAGYKAIIEASNLFGRTIGGLMTAAGRVPPAKVLVIGGGVAGLAAVAAARNLGAVVRCFDTRPAVREQVQSLGGEFLEVEGVQLEEGTGGYAKEMTKEFIEAEMALFAAQAKEVDIIVTTALVPGKPAPRLITREMIESMREGSVVVDLAAEMGGNIETTKKDEIYKYKGVTHIGLTDLPSRLPNQSSRLYSNNIGKLFKSMVSTKEQQYLIDLTDDVTRGCVVCSAGRLLWPPPALPAPTTQKEKPKTVVEKKAPPSPFVVTFKSALAVSLVMGLLFSVNMLSHNRSFLHMMTTFVLAGTAGYQAVWGVSPALHTPLMSVTNAISGVTAVGGMLLLGNGGGVVTTTLASLATAASCINIAGGFLITKRMLDMFKRPTDLPEHNYLYIIPGLVVMGLYMGAKLMGNTNVEPMMYLVAALFCVGSIGGLASQKTARYGNALGMLGVATAIAATFGFQHYSFTTAMYVVLLMVVGACGGLYLGSVVQVTQLPQTVAAFHSLVGLAAMVSAVANYSKVGDESSSLELISCILGCLIGGITLTGSIVAFGKLSAMMSSAALALPGKNYLNLTMLITQVSMIVVFMTPSLMSFMPSYDLRFLILCGTTVLSMIMGWHLVMSVGGGDMPVCITVLNSYSGWALVAEGFMLRNQLLTIVGSLIGFSGGILSYIMCVAMNRSLANVLFGGYATIAPSKAQGGAKKPHKETSIDEVSDLIGMARSVIVVPGYGMAVAKAQHALASLASTCRSRGIEFRFAIHPVAGRMPGQMNVLLAEAGVPYDWVFEMDDINAEFPKADLALVVGANDITNSAAEEDPTCAIAGMPVLQVWNAKTCIFMKRSMASGYADLENLVFFKDNTLMLLGDAKTTVEALASRAKPEA